MRRIIIPIAVATAAVLLSGCGVAGIGDGDNGPHRIGESVQLEVVDPNNVDEEYEMSYQITKVKDVTDDVSDAETADESDKFVLVAVAITNRDSEPVETAPAYHVELYDDYGDKIGIPDGLEEPGAVKMAGFGERFWFGDVTVKPGETRRGHVIVQVSHADDVERVKYRVIPFDRSPQWWAFR